MPITKISLNGVKLITEFKKYNYKEAKMPEKQVRKSLNLRYEVQLKGRSMVVGSGLTRLEEDLEKELKMALDKFVSKYPNCTLTAFKFEIKDMEGLKGR